MKTLLAASALVVLAPPAQAADTGDLRGHVVDAGGARLAGARIVVSGPALGGERVVVTNADGSFLIPSLPPGQHRLQVELGGFAAADLSVIVRLDESAFVPVTLNVAGADLEVLVEGQLPVLDATRSAISTELTSQTLQGLPLPRSYQDAVNILPGVYGRVDTQTGGPGNGNPSVRGEGQYGNNYLVDGISTRDPANKTFGVNVPFDAIETLQVYTDGAPAEFGNATGMVVNVVTRDGGDEHHGSASYYLDMDAAFGTYGIADLDAGKEVPTDKRDFMAHELAVTAGGPIAKERLWYFGALTLNTSRSLFEGGDPDAPELARGMGGFAKLTLFATHDITLQYEITGSIEGIDNALTSSQIAAEAQARQHTSSLGHIATARWLATPQSEVELKLSWLPQQVNLTPMSNDEDTPSLRNVETGEIYGNHDAFDDNQRGRLGGSLKITQYAHLLGEHRFKIGAEAWRLTDSRELVFTGPGEGIQYWASPDAGFPCTTNDFSDCIGYTEYTEVGEPLGHRGSVMGGFVQDDWSPWRSLTANVGARLDREVLYQNEGDRVIDAWMPAPRVGLAWDVTRDSRTLALANWGRYYDLSGNSFAAWGDTRSSFIFREFNNDGAGNYDLVYEQNPEQDPLVFCTEQSLDEWKGQLTDVYGYTGPDAQQAVDRAWNRYCGGHALRPYHMDKLVVGLEREVVPRLVVAVRGIASLTSNIPEDINVDLDTWVIANPPNKQRDYRALEVTVERTYDHVWQALFSYTLSASRGHTPGQFEVATGGQTGSDGNNVGVYMDDVSDPAARDGLYDAGLGWLVDGLAGLGTATDDAGYYGYLPYHSFHQLKLSGFYTLPWGTNAGLVYEFDSGHAWQRRGFVDLYGDYFGFPEGRGTRFMPSVHYFDVRVGHTFRMGGWRELEIVLDVFNVLDLGAPISNYENDNDSFGLALYRQSPRAARLGLRFRY